MAIIKYDVIALVYGFTTQPTNMKLSQDPVVYGATLLINKKYILRNICNKCELV